MPQGNRCRPHLFKLHFPLGRQAEWLVRPQPALTGICSTSRRPPACPDGYNTAEQGDGALKAPPRSDGCHITGP